MADKLIYKGGANVVGQTGTEMQLVLPSAGSTHRFPRWWNKKGTVAYVDAAIFLVTLDSGVKVRLVVPITVGRNQALEIRHDGFGNFTFPVRGVVERVAVVSEVDTTLYKEYQFSKISGGSVLTRTVEPIPQPVVKAAPAPKPAPKPEPKAEEEAKPKAKSKKKTAIKVEPIVIDEPSED